MTRVIAIPNLRSLSYAVVAAGLARSSPGKDVVILFGAGRRRYRRLLSGAARLEPVTRRRLAERLDALAPALVHYHIGYDDDLGMAAAMARRPGFLMVTLQDWYRAPSARLLRRADKITCVSAFVRRRLLSAYPWAARKTAVVPNGFSPHPRHRMARGRRPARPYVLSVARVLPAKGTDVLLFAFSRLLERFPSLKLVLVGDGLARWKRWLKDLVRRLRLEDHVVYREHLAPAAVSELMRNCLCLALPSRREAFGMAALEAMAAGKPVVAADVGGLSEIIAHGRTGLLVPPRDPAALAAALDRVVSDAALRRRLGRAAARRVRRELSWSAVARRYAGLLNGRAAI